MPGEPAPQQLQKEERFQKLKAAVELTVFDLCSELESELGVKFSPEVVASLSHLASDKTRRSAEDLEAFAQHAKRTNVTADDVKLLTRRNPKLQAHLASLQKEVPVKAAVGGKHVKKTVKKKDDTNSGGAAASGSRASVSGAKSIPPLID